MIHNPRSRRQAPYEQQRGPEPFSARDLCVRIVRCLVTDRLFIALALLLIGFTVLAMGPIRPIDEFINTLPRLESALFRTFLIHWPDTIASRAVALPVLGLVALYLAVQVRSWRPLVLGTGAVFTMICLVAGMKLILARSHPRTYDPSFFVDFGQNFSFPSGHGANATLIYGVALYLIVRYRAVRPFLVVRLGYAIAGIALVQAVVSAYLRFHWASDLVAGMLAGIVVLRAAVLVDRLVPSGLIRGRWPFHLPEPQPAPPAVVPSVPAVRGTRAPAGRYRPSPGRSSARLAGRPGSVRPTPTRPYRTRPVRPSAGEAPPTPGG